MENRSEHDFAELILERRKLESFANERSAYHQESESEAKAPDNTFRALQTRLRWHISHTLSSRQREVIRLILKGKREREIAQILGITQQVAHIYKWRAIKRLRGIFS